MPQNIYKIFEPRHELKPFIRRFMLADCKTDLKMSIKPKPTGYQYIGWVLGHELSASVNEVHQKITYGDFHLSGQIEHQDITFNYHGVFIHVLAEFTALGLYQLTKICGDQCTGKMHFVSELNSELSVMFNQLNSTINNTPVLSRANTCLLSFQNLLTELIPNKVEVPEYLSKAVDQIEAVHGQIKISTVLEKLNISQRQLDRKFKEVVGISPKYFARVLQLNRAIQALLENDKEYMLYAADQGGFYDQAHFGRTMQEFMTLSPLEFLSSEEHMLFDFLGKSRKL